MLSKRPENEYNNSTATFYMKDMLGQEIKEGDMVLKRIGISKLEVLQVNTIYDDPPTVIFNDSSSIWSPTYFLVVNSLFGRFNQTSYPCDMFGAPLDVSDWVVGGFLLRSSLYLGKILAVRNPGRVIVCPNISIDDGMTVSCIPQDLVRVTELPALTWYLLKGE